MGVIIRYNNSITFRAVFFNSISVNIRLPRMFDAYE